jgi:hypothetical protein
MSNTRMVAAASENVNRTPFCGILDLAAPRVVY